MSREVLRDAMGRKLAEIETKSNGVRVLRTPMHERLGEYDPKTNVTRDSMGRKIGEGNLLTTLIR